MLFFRLTTLRFLRLPLLLLLGLSFVVAALLLGLAALLILFSAALFGFRSRLALLFSLLPLFFPAHATVVTILGLRVDEAGRG